MREHEEKTGVATWKGSNSWAARKPPEKLAQPVRALQPVAFPGGSPTAGRHESE
jgi:hypothetical protein